MLLSEPLVSLITFFRTSLIKFYHNSQRMSDSFLSLMRDPICTVLRPMTSRSLISHVCETRKIIMAILHWKQGLLCDKYISR